MVEEKAIWQVAGNLDQIEKAGLDKEFQWEPFYNDNKVPNRVVCKFDDKMKACDLYNKMRDIRIVSLRNWLD